MVQPLIERDFYGRKLTAPTTAPNLKKASDISVTKEAIALEFDQPVVRDGATDPTLLAYEIMDGGIDLEFRFAKAAIYNIKWRYRETR
jgi:hypothetical protein